MILKTLHLKNFRKFKEAYVEFPDGVTGVIGLNGVGKSTLFEALAWVLYGPVSARTSTNQIKRDGAESSDPCRVEVEFIFEDDTYRVVREMSGKSLQASGSATVNGKLAVSGAETLSKFIQRRLGMDWKSFYTSIFAKQKELNALSSMNPSERRQLILRMLGIDVVDDIIKEIRDDARDKKGMVEKLESDLTDEAGRSKKDGFLQELQRLEQEQKDFIVRIKDQKKLLHDKEGELKKAKKDCDAKKAGYETSCKTKEQLEEKKSRFEKKQRLEQDIVARESALKQRLEAVKQQQARLGGFKSLEKDLRALEEHQQKNTDALVAVVKQRERVLVSIKRLEEEVKEIKRKRSHIEKMGPSAKCPTCERVLGEQHNTLLKTYKEEATRSQDEIQRLFKEQEASKADSDRLTREKQALQKKTLYLRNQELEHERLQTAFSHMEREVQREQQELEKRRQEVKSIGQVSFDQQVYAQARTKMNETYHMYQQALSATNKITDEHQRLMLKQKDEEGKQNLLLQKKQQTVKHIQELERIVDRLKGERTEAQRLGMLSEVMDSYRTYLISQIRPSLSQHASELFADLTDGKYAEIELDEDYNLLVYDRGAPYGIERFSGGEEDLANLCMRLAISEIITERAGSVFQFIILDEIFGSQDSIRKQNIIRALNGFSAKFRQIFLITHVDDIKNLTEHTIAVSEDESGISALAVE